MEFGWFTYSLFSALFIGFSVSFYKMPSFRNYSPFISTFYANGLCAVLSLVLLISQPIPDEIKISVIGITWGLLFAATMVLQKIALAKVETNILFPITTSVSNVVTILIGVTILGESLSPLQFLGFAIIVLSIYLLSKKKGEFPRTSEIFLLASSIVVVSIFSKYIQKIGATTEPLFNLLLWQFIAASLGGLIGAFIFERDSQKELVSSKKYLLGSFLIGFFMFCGSWAILKSLSLAPLSLVYSIHPIYALVTAVSGALIFKENLTMRKIILILLAIVGVILIKIG